MNKADRLVKILKQLNAGVNPVLVKEEAKELLASISPKDLALAEQKLIEAGLALEELRNLCSIHIEVLRERLEKLKANLNPNHIIYTMIHEHDIILDSLNKLERINQTIQKMKTYDDVKEKLEELKRIAKLLVNTDSHHKREEEVLFPELEKRGIFGPPQILTMEHEELRMKKRELKELMEDITKIDFVIFKKKLDTIAKFLILTLQDHIFKENYILYPTGFRFDRPS